MWRRCAAVIFLRDVVQPAIEVAGWHCALAGGVLFRGQSSHDLDVVVYPHNSESASLDKLRGALEAAGLRQSHSVDRLHTIWRAKGSTDHKHVEIWMWRGRRVDIIVPSVRA